MSLRPNPLSDNALASRADAQDAVRQLFDPLKPGFSTGRTMVALDDDPTLVGDGIEGYARPLWGIAPLAAGGGEFDWWAEYREGLVNGTDPDHPEYWGASEDWSFHAVEMSAIGTTLTMAPGEIWEPLNGAEQEQVATWLRSVYGCSLADNNWHLFRVLATLGLDAVDADADWAKCAHDFDRIEDFAMGGGWYGDGGDHCDYYTAWAIHTYGLIYAAYVDERDEHAERAERYRERAAQFAPDFAHWFEEDGRALPYGRSLTYRFAQAAFWGALALADVKPDGLSWGQIRGLWQRNVRWWADQPIFADGGRLTLGYRYPTTRTPESYSAPQSPYWAMKAFLPLARDADHPFWRADPEPLPDRSDVVAQPQSGFVVSHQEGDTVALTHGQDIGYEDRYDKFAYSTRFGFGVPTGRSGLSNAAPDSTLLVAEAGDEHYHGRQGYETREIVEDDDPPVAHAAWTPLDGATAESWLVPAAPWHVRVHRLATDRSVEVAEGGFSLPRTVTDGPDPATAEGLALARDASGVSGLRDVGSVVSESTARKGRIVSPMPYANVMHPQTSVPVLTCELSPGTHWFGTAVVAGDDAESTGWERPPGVDLDPESGSLAVRGPDGEALFSRE